MPCLWLQGAGNCVKTPFLWGVTVAGSNTSIFYSGEIFNIDVVVWPCCCQSKPDKILLIQAEIDPSV